MLIRLVPDHHLLVGFPYGAERLRLLCNDLVVDIYSHYMCTSLLFRVPPQTALCALHPFHWHSLQLWSLYVALTLLRWKLTKL